MKIEIDLSEVTAGLVLAETLKYGNKTAHEVVVDLILDGIDARAAKTGAKAIKTRKPRRPRLDTTTVKAATQPDAANEATKAANGANENAYGL